MKLASIIIVTLSLAGCASTNHYQIYAENTAKMVQAANASEAACLLVLAEGVKHGDNSTRTAITSHVEKCNKPIPRIEPPKKNWLGF